MFGHPKSQNPYVLRGLRLGPYQNVMFYEVCAWDRINTLCFTTSALGAVSKRYVLRGPRLGPYQNDMFYEVCAWDRIKLTMFYVVRVWARVKILVQIITYIKNKKNEQKERNKEQKSETKTALKKERHIKTEKSKRNK